MKRTNLILAGVLAVQLILGVVAFWPRSASGGVAGGLLFQDVEIDRIVALTVEDEQGRLLTLERTAAGWVMPDADDYPADEGKITTKLGTLLALTTDRLVTRTSASHRRLRVSEDDFVTRLTLETDDGASRVLYLGSSPNYGSIHFRLDGQAETYLTDEVSAFDIAAVAGSWVDTAYFSMDPAEVERVTLQNSSGTYTFVRDEEGQWLLHGLAGGEELALGTINSTINTATEITLFSPLGTEEDEAYGLDSPTAVVTLKAGERVVTLLVGAQDPEDSTYVVKVSESPYYVRVAGYNVLALVENSREDFAYPPATPEGDSSAP